MARFMLCLAAILISCYASHGAEDQVSKSSRYGELNKYYHYTRDNPRVAEELLTTVASANNARTMRAKTVILVHGVGGSHLTSLNPTVRDALLTSEDVSVVVVDWMLYANAENTALLAVSEIGAGLANFIRVFVNARRITLNNLHLVGHGLGAQVVANAARLITTGTIARITALDPSRLIVNNVLNENDAAYVEVIHTDSEGSGISTSIGTVDIFPNGGSTQPGCTTSTITTTPSNFLLRDDSTNCNHDRAWQYFAASLTDPKLVGNQCGAGDIPSDANCRGFTLQLGNNELRKYGSGNFFVETSDKYPYFNELNCVLACAG